MGMGMRLGWPTGREVKEMWFLVGKQGGEDRDMNDVYLGGRPNCLMI